MAAAGIAANSTAAKAATKAATKAGSPPASGPAVASPGSARPGGKVMPMRDAIAAFVHDGDTVVEARTAPEAQTAVAAATEAGNTDGEAGFSEWTIFHPSLLLALRESKQPCRISSSPIQSMPTASSAC